MSAVPLPTPNPAVIAWARLEGGFDVARVAQRLSVKPERIVAWESGQKVPTVRQLMNLARLYGRPLGLFYQSAPPKVPPLAREYRRLIGVVPGEESPELRMALRTMVLRRETALDLMEELGEHIPEFTLRARLAEEPSEVGRRLREATGITLLQQTGWKDGYQAWREWRIAIESLGVLVFVFPGVPMAEARGLALLDQPLPVVGVNTKEAAESRPFTALHETIHLMLAAADEEAPALEDRHSDEQWRAIERFAEIAASHALLPEGALSEALLRGGAPQDLDGVRRLAGRFRITPLAMATRLRESGYWNWEHYRAWRVAWDAYLETLPPSKPFATPVMKALGRGGRTYTQLVLEALDANRITSVDASRYLDLKFQHFDKLREGLMGGAQSTVVFE